MFVRTKSRMNYYGFYTPKRQPNFIISDIISSADYYSIPIRFENPNFKIGKNPETNFVTCYIDNDLNARKVAERSTVVEFASKVICEANSFEELYKKCQNVEYKIDGSFAVKVITHGRKITNEMRREYISNIVDNLRLDSKVDLKNPDITVILIIEFEECGELIPLKLSVVEFLCNGNSKLPDKFNLKKRKFINKTSMESAVALYSASQALCGPGKIAFDPFCGSGSLLVACAVLGSYALGSDFDMPSMSQDRKKSILSNFQQYKLSEKFLGIAKVDFLSGVYRFEDVKILDAIVTDPPYGIREKQHANGISPLLPLLLKLYEFAAKALKVGGRLVYWLPAGYDLNEDDLPKHPGLKLISNCRQPLMSRYCRHLLTYEKIAEIDEPVVFNSYNASFLKVRELVFSSKEEFELIQKNSIPIKNSSPWDQDKKLSSNDYIEQLHKEIIDVCDWLKPTKNEIYVRKFIAYKYTKIIENLLPNSTVILIGSCEHDAYLPFSDFNLSINSKFENEETVLQEITKHLLKLKVASDGSTIFNEKVKSARIVDYHFGFKINITVQNYSAIQSNSRISSYFKRYPRLKQLFMFMKLFMYQNDLYSPDYNYSSYELFHICLFIIESNPDEENLGKLLINLFELIGKKLNYFTTGILVSPNPRYFSKVKYGLLSDNNPQALLIQDSYDHNNILGKFSKISTKFSEICRLALSSIQINNKTNSFLVSTFISKPTSIINIHNETEEKYELLQQNDFNKMKKYYRK